MDMTLSRFELVSDGHSIAQARAAARRYLAEHCPWAPAAAVALVVSELVTNAVRHASGWWRLRITADEQRLVVEVEDESADPPRRRPFSTAGEGGLGLVIVEKLTNKLEVRPNPAGPGKTVYAYWFKA
ncbi:ATP-binding protein [Actinospica sp. MGRD01-02]|uniref:ATP-binding protein n=1 Tax=Actinospica acidithermotolerans TaxID=2828514 RepID=A0A941E6V0_9ACTN|nr:ATP-binding protein [Actinospica acidithermotolerans]MBR7825018.1 ATP-binding protein [Actinospica acidithermotolerans]